MHLIKSHPSTGRPLGTNTTAEGPNSNPSLTRPAILGLTSDTRQSNNPHQLLTGQSAQDSQRHLMMIQSSSQRNLNSRSPAGQNYAYHAAAVAQPAVEQYMQAIPFDNLQREDDEDDEEEAYYGEEQILIEEQQEEPSQREDPSNHRGSGARNEFMGLSQTQQSQMQAQQQFVINQSAELEGLDLTEDDPDGHEMGGDGQHSQANID